jgi:WD40 repeat protein
MATVRESHTATLLHNGKVLITGGDDGYTTIATAELFDPTSGRFAPVGSMASARSSHTATLLKDGKVLVAGGRDAEGNILDSAELFDPGTEKFAPAGNMHSARQFHTATVLTNGKVLVTGGDDGSATLSTAELFDPATGRFTLVGSMQQARELHTATLRNDGTVLVVGGTDLTSDVGDNARAELPLESTATAELFDPSSGSFTSTSYMANPRARHTATLLTDGEVLVIGGTLSENSARRDLLASAELFQ